MADQAGGILRTIQRLVADGQVKISSHGYDELADDELFATEILAGLKNAIMIEEYPDYPKGPCVLVLQEDALNAPVHVVWGVPAGCTRPAVLVTAYRPDPERWSDDFLRRRQ